MKHLLSTADLSLDQTVALLDLSDEMALVNQRENRKLPTLRNKTVVNLFFEDSTRTRISFELAAKRLSADLINFTAKGSSVSKGESLKDTVQTLAASGVDAFVVRHSASGAPYNLAHSGWIDTPIVNAGDGTHEHPTQALLDAMTMRERLHGIGATKGRDLSGVKVAIVGDIAHSRVARSNVQLLNTLGADVHFIAPPTLMPNGFNATKHFNLDEALHEVKPDVVMMLRVQLERMNASFFPSESEYRREWGLTNDRFRRLNSGTVIMHPGPMNRGLEICAEAADSDQSAILQQVANGVNVRMAVLYSLISGEKAVNE
ncbi:MAG: aspartate carbamoyltransferase catalytic subunit [Micrococcales bacterium]